MSSLARTLKRTNARGAAPHEVKSNVPPMRVKPSDDPHMMAVMYAYLDYKLHLDVPLFLGAWPRARQLQFWATYEEMRHFDWSGVHQGNAQTFARNHHALMRQRRAGP